MFPTGPYYKGGSYGTDVTLDLVVTPAIFYAFGRKAAENALRLEAPAAQ